MPFVYLLQVFTGLPEWAVVGYLPLVAALIAKGSKGQTIQDEFMRHSLSILVFFVIAHNAISRLAILLSDNIAIAGRVLCLLVLPVGVFYFRQQWKLTRVIAITAILVSLKMLYENTYS